MGQVGEAALKREPSTGRQCQLEGTTATLAPSRRVECCPSSPSSSVLAGHSRDAADQLVLVVEVAVVHARRLLGLGGLQRQNDQG